MAIIPDFFLNAVVALGIDGGDGKKHWIGTGFIVGRKEIDNPNLSTYYIITNKHVIEQQNTSTFVSIRLEGSLLRIIELAYMTAWACLCSLRIRMIKQI